eukprot:501933_1
MKLKENNVKSLYRRFVMHILKHTKKYRWFGIFILSCIFRNIFWKIYHHLKSYPNGPLGLPLFGCLLNFCINPRRFLANIARDYGPISYFPIMGSNNVFISDHNILKDMYQNMNIVDRPELEIQKIPGFLTLCGEPWKIRRKYAMHSVMRLSKTTFILSNVKKCIEKYDYIEPNQTITNEKSLEKLIHFIAFNNIWSAVFDQILPPNDAVIDRYCKCAEKAMWRGSVNVLVKIATNFSKNIPNFMKWHVNYVQNVFDKEANTILIDWMNENGFVVDLERNILRRCPKFKHNENNFAHIDYMIEKEKNNEISVKEVISDTHNILLAAIDTTTKSSQIGFLYLAKYQKVQEMVYNELICTIKKHNLKEFHFKILHDLHIFRAFILEMLRIGCVAPVGVPHVTKKDYSVKINDKIVVVPKMTLVHSNTYYMQKYVDWTNNKTLSVENNDIHLEYWLDSDKRFKMNDNFVLFGVGKRDCVGRTIAMKILYSIFALFICKYKFMPLNNDPNAVHIKQSFSMVMGAYSSGIQIQKRN